MTRARLLLVLLLLSLVPLPQATASTAVGQADGSWTLRFDVQLAEARRATLSLDVAREDADGVVRGTRALGTADLPAGASVQEASFLPAEGAGRYDVTLVADGAPLASVAFDVADGGATRQVTYAVADEPTFLNLTSDDVNANNKTKSPGDAVVTRATLSDGNGLGDVDALLWSVEKDGAPFDAGALAIPGAAANTSAAIEHRYDRAPLPQGSYRLTLTAMHRDAPAASASRLFAIRDVAATLASGALAPVLPDAEGAQTVAIVLADRNGAPGAPLEARVYKGSARAEGAGLNATLGAPIALADADGAGRTEIPLTLRWPARAAMGAYRVSLYANGTLAGSLPFDVQELPALSSVNATTDAGALRLVARGSGNGTLIARLADGEGSATTRSAPFVNGSAEIALDAPRRGRALVWEATLVARVGGPTLDQRNGTWSAPLDGPAVELTAVHARGRLPAVWSVDASGWALDNVTVTLGVTRWDGAAETRVAARLDGDRLRLDGPADLEAGRYDARVVLSWPNGSASEATWSFEAGPWTRVALGEPVVENGTVTMAVRNDGGRAIGRLAVEADPAPASWRLQSDGATQAASGARAGFGGLALSPGEEATLSFALPAGPRRAGEQTVTVRVLAPVGA